MSFSFYVFPTEFDNRVNVNNVRFAMQKAMSVYLQNEKIKLDIVRYDVLSYPFREIAWQNDEEFTWRHHEIEEVLIKWKDETGQILGEIEVWNDYLASSYVGVLEDFIEGSIPKEVEKKIQDLGFHWRFQYYSESEDNKNYKLAAILGTTLANLSNGIIMFDKIEKEEGIPPLKPQEFLKIVINDNF